MEGGVFKVVCQIETGNSWLETEGPDDEGYADHLRDLRRALRLLSEKVARQVRARERGYGVDDEAYYSKGALIELLEIYYQCGVVEDPPITATESVRQSGKEGGTYGNFLVSLLDVKVSLGKIPMRHREVLWLRFGPLALYSDTAIANMAQSEIRDTTGWHWARLRSVLGETGEDIRTRVDRALWILQKALGGSGAWRTGTGLERAVRAS